MDIKTLKIELKRLEKIEEKLLDFLIFEEDLANLAFPRILEVSRMIVHAKTLINEMENKKK